MRLFRYILHGDEKIGVAKDKQDAYNRRAEVDPSFHFLPVTVEELVIPGYEITVKPVRDVDSMDREQLKEYLTEKGVKFFKGADEDKLRELARSV